MEKQRIFITGSVGLSPDGIFPTSRMILDGNQPKRSPQFAGKFQLHGNI